MTAVRCVNQGGKCVPRRCRCVCTRLCVNVDSVNVEHLRVYSHRENKMLYVAVNTCIVGYGFRSRDANLIRITTSTSIVYHILTFFSLPNNCYYIIRLSDCCYGIEAVVCTNGLI